MASKGNNRHVKRLAVGKYVRVSRKTAAYLAKPRAGRHSLESSIALFVVLRDKLSLADTSHEAKNIIRTGKIEVNGKIVRDEKFAVGFGDIVKLRPTGEAFVIGISKKGVITLDKSEAKAAERTLKVTNKYLVKGSKPMARLFDGSVVEATKELMTNDSVVVEGKKIKKTIKFESGAKCFVIKGTHASKTGTIKEITKGSALREATVRVESGSDSFETLVDNIMVVGA